VEDGQAEGTTLYIFFSLNNFCFGEKRPEPQKKKERKKKK
jgi:uncharacterized protein with ParB-like and HNH nuclease domain